MSVSVWVSSPDTRSERRYDLHTTVGTLKVGRPLDLPEISDSTRFRRASSS